MPLTLLGAGMDETRIVCAAEGSAIQITADVLVGASHLTIAHEGPVAAHVVQASIGTTRTPELPLHRGYARRCPTAGRQRRVPARDGQRDDHQLPDGREPKPRYLHRAGSARQRRGVILCDNGQHGIAFHADAGGTVTNTKAKANGKHGIRLGEQVRVKLRGNTCEGNGMCGIAFAGGSAGEAARNSCSKNGTMGIKVEDRAHPDLGQYVRGQHREWHRLPRPSRGTVPEQQRAAEQAHGVLVQDRASPLLARLEQRGTRAGGICLHGDAGGQRESSLRRE